MFSKSQEAYSAYRSRNYIRALRLYETLDARFKGCFNANILLCHRQLQRLFLGEKALDKILTSATDSHAIELIFCLLVKLKQLSHVQSRIEDGLRIESTLSTNKLANILFYESTSLETLLDDTAGYIKLELSGDLDARIIVITDKNSDQERRVTVYPGSWTDLRDLGGAKKYGLYLRICGPGQANIKNIRTRRLKAPYSLQNELLLIVNRYPSENEIYSNGFVHRRAVEWRRRGVNFAVFVYNNKCDPSSYDYEGIPVYVGGDIELQHALLSGAVKACVIHFLSEALWQQIQSRIGQIKIFLWLHGADIQSWHRRVKTYSNMTELRKGIAWSEKRINFWKKLFRANFPGVYFIFVSKYLLTCSVEDEETTEHLVNSYIINNYIDTTLFSPCAVELRRKNLHNILSIRPYTSNLYANDLTAAVIKLLAREKIFSTLQFTIVGEGKNFDSINRDISQYSNVKLIKAFLPQPEIAKLHRKHGIFLIPTRADTQGVSRDEAMASGMVVVTNAVQAVPEFISASEGRLLPGEDVPGMARAIVDLVEDDVTYLTMSERAAAAVRSRRDGITDELNLIRGDGLLVSCAEEGEALKRFGRPPKKRIAIFGDVNLNSIDGSSVWAASLALTFSEAEDCEVFLFSKMRLTEPEVVASLRSKSNVWLIEPFPSRVHDPNAVLDLISEYDRSLNFSGLVIRGSSICKSLACYPVLTEKSTIYLTDLPENLSTDSQLRSVMANARYLGAQTRKFASRFVELGLSAERILDMPPIIPAGLPSLTEKKLNKIIYSGKFATAWMSEGMLDIFKKMKLTDPEIEIAVIGDKINQSFVDTDFHLRVDAKLREFNDNGIITWISRSTRVGVFNNMSSARVGWAFRDPGFERDTLELSTKVLEYCSCGVIPIVARNTLLEELLGVDYPFFATTLEDAHALAVAALKDDVAVDRLAQTFTEIRSNFSGATTFRRSLYRIIDGS